MRPVARLALAACLIATGSTAAAQTTPAPPPTGAQDGSGAAPAPSASASAGGDVGGYSYNDKPTRKTRARAVRKHHDGPVVSFPGFQETPDGGSRLFVGLSSSVPVEERRAQGTVTYILKGASARVRNNTNALVTVHFNTPVSRARLVPHGKDLHFVIDLRADVSPTWKMAEGPDRTSVLQIDFPKGNWGPAADTGDADRPAAPKKAGAGKKNPSPAPSGDAKPAPTGPSP